MATALRPSSTDVIGNTSNSLGAGLEPLIAEPIPVTLTGLVTFLGILPPYAAGAVAIPPAPAAVSAEHPTYTLEASTDHAAQPTSLH